jgi:hypothetical protein
MVDMGKAWTPTDLCLYLSQNLKYGLRLFDFLAAGPFKPDEMILVFLEQAGFKHRGSSVSYWCHHSHLSGREKEANARKQTDKAISVRSTVILVSQLPFPAAFPHINLDHRITLFIGSPGSVPTRSWHALGKTSEGVSPDCLFRRCRTCAVSGVSRENVSDLEKRGSEWRMMERWVVEESYPLRVDPALVCFVFLRWSAS